jgi:hypothetical protein
MITVFNGLATGCPCHLYEVAKVVMAIADVEDFTLQTKRLMLIVFREQDEGGRYLCIRQSIVVGGRASIPVERQSTSIGAILRAWNSIS